MGRPSLDTERREQIMSAFEACVLEFGLHKTTLQKVADAAGLPRPLVRHFVGNKDQMISLLLERLLERGVQDLNGRYDENLALPEMLDFLFDGVFVDETSNQLVDQLWQVSYHNDAVKAQLRNLYAALQAGLVQHMAQAGLSDVARNHDVAQMLISLAFGETFFTHIGMVTRDKRASRKLADQLIESLKGD